MVWEEINGNQLIANGLWLSISAVRTYCCAFLHIFPFCTRIRYFKERSRFGMTTSLALNFGPEARHPSLLDTVPGSESHAKSVRQRNESNQEPLRPTHSQRCAADSCDRVVGNGRGCPPFPRTAIQNPIRS